MRFSVPDSSRRPAHRSGCGRLRCGRGCGSGWPVAAPVVVGVAALDGAAAGARGDGRARSARPAGALAAAAHPGRHGVVGGGRVPRRAWRPSRPMRSGPPAVGCCRRSRSGCRTSPMPAAPVSRWSAPCWSPGSRAGCFALAAGASGSLARADAGAPGDQRSGRDCRRWRAARRALTAAKHGITSRGPPCSLSSAGHSVFAID